MWWILTTVLSCLVTIHFDHCIHKCKTHFFSRLVFKLRGWHEEGGDGSECGRRSWKRTQGMSVQCPFEGLCIAYVCLCYACCGASTWNSVSGLEWTFLEIIKKGFVNYESMERNLLKPTYECRCNGRLQTKRVTRLTHTGSVVELEHLKIKTRLTNEKFASVKGECEI
jgi:hypothetical protein